jgi:hypothetical protein
MTSWQAVVLAFAGLLAAVGVMRGEIRNLFDSRAGGPHGPTSTHTSLADTSLIVADESFGGRTTTNPNWKMFGTAKLTGEGDGWLRMTDTTGGVGGTVLDDPFSSRGGVRIEFDYATYGGTGGAPSSSAGGDGYTIFLMDGDKQVTGLGSGGAGLGYACLIAAGPSQWAALPLPPVGNCTGGYPGVAGGFVGIGFDERGFFSSTFAGNGAAREPMPNHVAIRGSGTGLMGYRYLSSVDVAGGIETGSRAGARRVRVTVIDRVVTVEMKNSGEFQKVIEVNLAGAADQAPLPSTFKVGFGAATGKATNIHEIRKVLVQRLPKAQGLAPD